MRRFASDPQRAHATVQAMLGLLGATSVALALSGVIGEPRPSTDARAVNGARIARFAADATPAVSRRVERLRGLRFRRIPEPRVVTASRLGRIERRAVEREGGLADLAASEAAGRILGLIRPTEELENAVGASEELAAAAYEPRTKRLFVVADAVGTSRVLFELFLAHELNHALEDARFRLDDAITGAGDDAALAELALTEGTAMAVMSAYASRHLDPIALTLAIAGLDTGTGDVPEAVVEQIEWAYLGGMRFVERLRELGGGWTLVDHALSSRPPASTEQVLHPRRYIRGELPNRVRIDAGRLGRTGWKRADRGAIGELATRQLLELGANPRRARRAAAGWGGDRYELWRGGVAPARCATSCRDHLVLVNRWRWETRRDVAQFAAAYFDYLEGGLRARPATVTRLAGGGYVALAASERAETAVVFAPRANLARALAEEQVAAARP